MNYKLASGNNALQQGQVDSLILSEQYSIPVQLTDLPLSSAVDTVFVRSNEELAILARLADYPYVYNLLDPVRLKTALAERKALFGKWLADGIYIYGAYKVGSYIAGQARQAGIEIHGFLDRDAAKKGSFIDGVEVFFPTDLDLRNLAVVVASGQHSNEICAGLVGVCDKVMNLHEFAYTVGAGHGPEKYFSSVAHQPIDEAYRYISTFLRLGDERSREVFNGLIGKRTMLSLASTGEIKSPAQDEYFDKDFVAAEQAHYFVDAGAFTGDTLANLERHFGPVKQAYLFEPEMPPYYEALKRFAERENVWVFNMGLDATPSRFEYNPALSCNVLGEIEGPISSSIVSYIQGVPLDALVSGKVGLFKLDIEGMEERALMGAAAVIKREKPVLAVCAYHRADDYWKLIDVVDSLRPDYRVAIRHYADILHDITLYFY